MGIVASLYPLGTFINNLYIGDLFDVIIIALLIYTALFLFKQTRSFFVLIGVGILLSIYAMAQVFRLYLTALVLQSFFSVFLIVLVVIFQEELRRFLEFIAAVGTRQIRAQQAVAGSDSMNEMLQAFAYLAHEKIGALVVLRGRENIDRHIEGGTLLDGIISEDLIISIFDPTSPGHDGAIIIYKDRISKLGTHLPLSSNFKEIGKHGTRHSAALGIAEHSDALAVIVSEEQGTISITHSGRLKTLKNIEELREELTEFLKETSPDQAYSALENLIKRNSIEKVAALFLSALLWFFFAFQADSVQQTFTLPISYRNVPENLIIEDSQPLQLIVTMEGRGKLVFERSDPNLFGITVDASNISDGKNTISVNENMISRPLNFSVVNISPQSIEIAARRYQTITVPIEARVEGSPAAGFALGGIILTPGSLTLLVPDLGRPPQSIPTHLINISNIRETSSFSTTIDLPNNFRLKDPAQSAINVSVEVRKK